MTNRWGVTVDCHDPALVAAFWATALGYQEPPAPAGFATWEDWLAAQGVPAAEWNDGAYLGDPDGVLPGLSFLKVPESKIVKNRVHLDIQIGGGRSKPQAERWARVVAEADRLVAAGATVIGIDDQDGRPDHYLMADPEGNEFCIV